MAERDYYAPVKAHIERLLEDNSADFHVEITAQRAFSSVLKAQVGQHRDIVFHFLREAAPDITGFVRTPYSADFIVVEIKVPQLKLDDIYQTRRYAELFDARYAILVSLEHVPEEFKRLHKVTYSLLALPAYKTLCLAKWDPPTSALTEWYPSNPFTTA
jgi:hypothetical protein